MKLRLAAIEQTRQLRSLSKWIYEDPGVREFAGWRDQPKHEAIRNLTNLWLSRWGSDWDVYAVQRDDRPVGLAGWGAMTSDTSCPYMAIYLRERNRGIGTFAGKQLLTRARANGYRRMGGIIHGSNEAAKALLKGLGFRLSGPYCSSWSIESSQPWLRYICFFSSERVETGNIPR